jgi:hypothetical protein
VIYAYGVVWERYLQGGRVVTRCYHTSDMHWSGTEVGRNAVTDLGAEPRYGLIYFAVPFSSSVKLVEERRNLIQRKTIRIVKEVKICAGVEDFVIKPVGILTLGRDNRMHIGTTFSRIQSGENSACHIRSCVRPEH